MQWARVQPELVVVASEQRSWCHRLPAGGLGDPFVVPMTEAVASRSSMQQLLDGALVAARQILPPPTGRPLTAIRWVWRLAYQYHTTHGSPELLEEASHRFRTLGNPRLAERCARKRDEERGHDALALRDLRTLGYPAEAVAGVFRPPGAVAVVDFFAACVHSTEPVRLFGYCYALERSAMMISNSYIQDIQRLLPAGVMATRCLRVHSSVGSDPRHVAEDIDLLATLSAAQRTAVAQACFETGLVMNTVCDEDDPPEEQLLASLDGLAVQTRCRSVP